MPQKIAWDTIGKVAIVPEPAMVKESPGWWYTEAQKAFGRECPKCHNQCTQGLYVPPHTMNGECAVVNNCLICGHEEIVRRGKNHAPMSTAEMTKFIPRMTERQVKLPNNPLNHHKKHKGGNAYGS